MYVSILGRQAELSVAELESVFGEKKIELISNEAAMIDTNQPPNINILGGSVKVGRIINEISFNKDWHKSIKYLIDYYLKKWEKVDYKITLGLSYYGHNQNERDIQKIGILIKQGLKKKNASLRLIPNKTKALSSAVSHHNKLGLSSNKVELMIIRTKANEIIVAESIGAQNITAYAKRDQERPKRDAFVGMLPPKLAQIMINLACGQILDNKLISLGAGATSIDGTLEPESKKAPEPFPDLERSSVFNGSAPKSKHKNNTILDPFCGTGVILQEAALMGFDIIGTDISQKMIDYSEENIRWLENKYDRKINKVLQPGDATKTRWPKTIDAVVSETYLGQPFSAPPSDDKLNEVKKNCSRIILKFLQNLHAQIRSDTPICIAIPAWINKDDNLVRLQIDSSIEKLGYKKRKFSNISAPLIYRRENQIVSRELLVLKKI